MDIWAYILIFNCHKENWSW